MIKLLWVFILVVTLVDIEFALRMADSMATWESNPAMRWVVINYGVMVACAFRLTTTTLSCLLCLKCKSSIAIYATLIAGVAHVYLAMCYVAIYL